MGRHYIGQQSTSRKHLKTLTNIRPTNVKTSIEHGMKELFLKYICVSQDK